MPWSRKLVEPVLSLAALLAASPAAALPIGFGVNQGDLEYSELRSDHFVVYHDARVASEGQMTMNALESARPTMERWFDHKRSSRLPVIMSAVTDNASFANFITDAIELQTLGQGSRDLAWHEYTHSTMYRRLDNLLGPAGTIVHLPWMPAWFLEGLAESLSVSAGSDVTAGIERYQALTGNWPSYDRLHSLYSKYDFSERGYATSGAIVTWTLKQGDANKLPQLLDDFYDYTMPWWWPWSVVPFNGFLPMDAALKRYAGVGGEELYTRYKQAAADHWKRAGQGPFLVATKGPRVTLGSTGGLKSDGEDILHVTSLDGDLWEVELTFDEATGWASGWEKRYRIPSDRQSYGRLTGPLLKAGISYDDNYPSRGSTVVIRQKGTKRDIRIPRKGNVYGLFESTDSVGWWEHELAATRACVVAKPLKQRDNRVTCAMEAYTPERLRIVGTRPVEPGSPYASEVWVAKSAEHLTGSLHELHVLDARTLTPKRKLGPFQGRPVSVAFNSDKTDDVWVLLAERSTRTVRRYDAEGACRGMMTFKDHILDLHGTAAGDLVLAVYAGGDAAVMKLPRKTLAEKACVPDEGHTSPLLVAMQHEGQADLRTALAGSDLWAQGPRPLAPDDEKTLLASPPLDRDPPKGLPESAIEAEPARWRGRPVFLFPWIGADDALGTQLGAVSVPLMDHMQNETVRATWLYGLESRFPYQELAITSTRFTPTINLAVYRQQTYNGQFTVRRGEERGVVTSYLEERGGRLEGDVDFRALGGRASLGLGLKYAHLKPYLGPQINGHGWLAEPSASLSLVHTAWRLTFSNSLSGRIAPEGLNEEFDYNQLGASSNVSLALPFLRSRTSLGLEGSRMRGKERRDFQEVYRPLKTFIPGSGGGYNQNSFPLVDADGLFSPVFGDTQARAKANWTLPLIPDVDKLLWILYLERLDFTAFYNYGAAWVGPEPRRGWRRLIRAHGYNLDLQLENKGVRFNVGLGTGQVVSRGWEAYVTTGFDALF